MIKFRDVDKFEFFALFVLAFLVILFGVYPMCIVRVIEAPISFLLVDIKDQISLITYFDKAHLVTFEECDNYIIIQETLAPSSSLKTPSGNGAEGFS